MISSRPLDGGRLPTRMEPEDHVAATSAVADAADAALASALAHLGVEGEIRQKTEPVPALETEDIAPEEEVDMVGMADMVCRHIPSVVTFGGQPVAADGDLIYLGGGLYASAAPQAPKEAPAVAKGKPRLMPGRVRAGPRAAVGGQRSGRSASASARGAQGASDLGLSPPHSRAHSDGPPAPLLSDAASEKEKGPRAWRPAGAAKLPQPPSETAGRHGRAHAPLEDICEGGGHSEVRALEREQARREGGGLFGAKGLLGEISRMQEMPVAPRGGVTGAPHNSDARAMERRLAKEARVEQVLAERAERLAVEAELRPKVPLRSTPGSSSAPVLPMLPRPLPETPTRASPEDLEKQKLRVACKMEMLDFFNGYAKNIGKMSADQTKALLVKLHGGLEAANGAYPAGGGSGPPSSRRLSPNADKPFLGVDASFARPPGEEGVGEGDGYGEEAALPEWLAEGEDTSVKGRLQHVNDVCNKAFDACLLEDEGF